MTTHLNAPTTNGTKPTTPLDDFDRRIKIAVDAAVQSALAKAIPVANATLLRELAGRLAGPGSSLTRAELNVIAEKLDPTPRPIERPVAPPATMPVMLELKRDLNLGASYSCSAQEWARHKAEYERLLLGNRRIDELVRKFIAAVVTAATQATPTIALETKRLRYALVGLTALPPVEPGSLFELDPEQLAPPIGARAPDATAMLGGVAWVRDLAAARGFADRAVASTTRTSSAPTTTQLLAAQAAEQTELNERGPNASGNGWDGFDAAREAVEAKYRGLIAAAQAEELHARRREMQPLADQVADLVDAKARELAATAPGSLAWLLVSTLRSAWDPSAPRVDLTPPTVLETLQALGVRWSSVTAGGVS